MRHIVICVHAGLIAWLASTNAAAAESSRGASVLTDRLAATPDLTQTAIPDALPGGGEEYCGPVSVSNSLMWLDANGFPNLVRNTLDPIQDQIRLAQTLGSLKYMNTSQTRGTGPRTLLKGVERYVRERGYETSQLGYRGIGRKFRLDEDLRKNAPSLDWIRQALDGNGVAWLNIGWYGHSAERNVYRRLGGHWVTLVGYGMDEDGRENSHILIIHDPHPRAGEDFANHHVLLERLQTGTIEGYGLPQDARGYYKAAGGMCIPPEADAAILEGAAMMRLNAPALADSDGGSR